MVRLRMEIDLTSKTWSITVDDKLNGFDDDQVHAGLGISAAKYLYWILLGMITTIDTYADPASMVMAFKDLSVWVESNDTTIHGQVTDATSGNPLPGVP
jgi:hypothetical protein